MPPPHRFSFECSAFVPSFFFKYINASFLMKHAASFSNPGRVGHTPLGIFKREKHRSLCTLSASTATASPVHARCTPRARTRVDTHARVLGHRQRVVRSFKRRDRETEWSRSSAALRPGAVFLRRPGRCSARSRPSDRGGGVSGYNTRVSTCPVPETCEADTRVFPGVDTLLPSAFHCRGPFLHPPFRVWRV